MYQDEESKRESDDSKGDDEVEVSLKYNEVVQSFWCPRPESNRHGITTAGF